MSPASHAARIKVSFSLSAGDSSMTGVARGRDRLPELTERETVREGVREAMTLPASRAEKRGWRGSRALHYSKLCEQKI